ncbi:MAG: hypothetical protein ACOVSW_06225 [Candidatus Kapaibacteriota bacterium]
MITFIIFYFSYSTQAQSLAIEGGAAAVPTLLPSWVLGATVQVPIIERFSVGVGYFRWSENRDKLAVIAKNPRIEQNDPRYSASITFPGFRGDFWGNSALNIYASYRFIEIERLSLESGLGLALVQRNELIADAAFLHAIYFLEGNFYNVNRLSGLLQARYNLSDSFALQGKIAAFGTEHFTATVGISWMPWGDKTSLVAVLTPLFAPDK